jgi:hypothetical protein
MQSTTAVEFAIHIVSPDDFISRVGAIRAVQVIGGLHSNFEAQPLHFPSFAWSFSSRVHRRPIIPVRSTVGPFRSPSRWKGGQTPECQSLSSDRKCIGRRSTVASGDEAIAIASF